MSTKRSIAWSDEFHFYQDLMEDNESYHLRIDHPCGHSDEITIPGHIWEVIRQSAKVDFSLIGVTDEEILKRATEEAKQRLEDYKQASEGSKALFALFGSGIYGDVDWPLEKQIKEGVEYFKAERVKQCAIKDKVLSIQMLKQDDENF